MKNEIKSEIVFETENLKFRKINKDDFNNLSPILKDPEIMYAWEHGFSDEEVYNWIDENLKRYREDGFSYCIGIEKKSGNIIGMIGPLMENINGEKQIGAGWILDKKFWGKGYAEEGGKGAVKYAFEKLGAEKVVAAIRTENIFSRKNAEKLGMKIEGSYVKIYRSKEMEHLIYAINKSKV